jgi:large conductance mechanosensitive channel
MIKEFKEFIAQGNALELAIGVIIGAAFGAVVTSLVNDVLMQIVGMIFGQPTFDDVSIHFGDKLDGAAAEAVQKAHPGVTDVYEKQIFIGSFITKIINFLIIAFIIFLVVKAVNKMKKPKVAAEAAPAGPSEVELLTEIRDALAKR